MLNNYFNSFVKKKIPSFWLLVFYVKQHTGHFLYAYKMLTDYFTIFYMIYC